MQKRQDRATCIIQMTTTATTKAAAIVDTIIVVVIQLSQNAWWRFKIVYVLNLI
jgi:hypothetical protein